MIFSNVLRIASRTSVKVLSNMFGIDGELYYPKGFESGRGGVDDEIIYNDTPDWTGKFLAPFVFGNAKQHFGGFFDELNGDEKAMYFDDTMTIPINSLIVLTMQAGNQMYKVYDLQSNNDELGHIYSKVIVVPVTKDNLHTLNNRELNKEFAGEMLEDQIDVDDSTEEFLNDLMGKGFADIEKTANSDDIIDETEIKVSDDSIISISESDLI